MPDFSRMRKFEEKIKVLFGNTPHDSTLTKHDSPCDLSRFQRESNSPETTFKNVMPQIIDLESYTSLAASQTKHPRQTQLTASLTGSIIS
jgi:hypothetical protein